MMTLVVTKVLMTNSPKNMLMVGAVRFSKGQADDEGIIALTEFYVKQSGCPFV